MAATKLWTKTDLKDTKILTLTSNLSNSDKNKTSVLVTVDPGGTRTIQDRRNNKVIESRKNYVEALGNL